MSSMTLGPAIKPSQEAYERIWSDSQETIESSTSKTGRHSATTPVAAIESASRASEGSLQRRALRKVQQCCYHYLALGAQSEAGDVPNIQILDEYDENLAWEVLCLTHLSQKLPKQLHQHLVKHPKKTGEDTAKAISQIYGVPYWKELGYQNPPSYLKRFDVAIKGGYEIGLKFLIKEVFSQAPQISRDEFKETASRIIKAFPEEDVIIASVLTYPHLSVIEKLPIFFERGSTGKFLIECIAKNDLQHSAREYLKIWPAIEQYLTGLSIEHQSRRVLGQLLLWELCKNNPSMDVIRNLLNNEADVHVRDQKGLTPLHLAAAKGQTEVVDLLISHQAEVDIQTFNGVTPLHFAAGHGYKEIIELLISHRAKVDIQAQNGSTPLHFAVALGAAALGQEKVVELLKNLGASLDICNHENKTACDIAKEKGYTKIVQILSNNGTKRKSQSTEITGVKKSKMTPPSLGKK